MTTEPLDMGPADAHSVEELRRLTRLLIALTIVFTAIAAVFAVVFFADEHANLFLLQAMAACTAAGVVWVASRREKALERHAASEA